MPRVINELPWWVLITGWFVFFAVLSVVARKAVHRAGTDERRTEHTDYAGRTLTPIGATFGFLIGFCATMTWSALNAGQEAIDSESTSIQQLVWATKSISDKAGAVEILGNVKRYLSAAVEQDPAFLARGETTDLPSSQAFDALQHSVHNVAYGRGTNPEASAMTSAAAALTGAQAKVTAVAQRSLPPLLFGLLVASGALLAAAMGTAGADVSRPYLMYGWAFVSALGVTLIIALDVPFGSAVRVNMAPLVTVSDAMIAQPLSR